MPKHPNTSLNNLYSKAIQLSPGGVTSSQRSSIIFAKSAVGSKIHDVGGNEYIDYSLAGGAHILGYQHQSVVRAVKEQLDKNMHICYPSEIEIKYLQKLVDLFPSAEMVRPACSGSEATLYAVRLARAFTGRKKIVKFEGAFHGVLCESLLISHWPPLSRVGDEKNPNNVQESNGMLDCNVKNTIVLPFNNAALVEETLEQKGNEVAAIIVEPVQRAIPPKKDFLSRLRTLTKKHGTILIFDEVATGCRLALGGAQEYYGVTPDLTTLGKVIGAGFPCGALVGKREIMELMNPKKRWSDNFVEQAGTFSSMQLQQAAGLAVFSELEKTGVYQKLNSYGDQLRKGLQDAGDDAGLPMQVVGTGSMWNVHFTDKEVVDYRSATSGDQDRRKAFFKDQFQRGILLAESRSSISTAHTDKDLQSTLKKFSESVKTVVEIKT